jgi:hypothetical protein
VTLAAGTWKIEILTQKSANRAKLDVYFGSTNVGTLDAYNSPDVNNSLMSISGISVATTGKYRLKGTVNGRNASATAYYWSFQAIRLIRTA